MAEQTLLALASIIILGIGAQWLAGRLRLPSILLLLVLGFLAGPVTGLINPDETIGDLLFPLVSIAVGIILFEGGLSLRFSELPKLSNVIFRQITIGALVTWLVAALAAHHIDVVAELVRARAAAGPGHEDVERSVTVEVAYRVAVAVAELNVPAAASDDTETHRLQLERALDELEARAAAGAARGSMSR